MNAANINNDAERKILAKLFNNPNLTLDLENVIKPKDFYTAVAQNIFSAIRDIALGNTDLLNTAPVDAVLLEEKIANIFPEYYKSQSDVIKQAIEKIKVETPPSDKDLKELIRITLSNSLRRQYLKKIDTIKHEIEQIDSPDRLANHIECSTLEFTTNLFRSSDIGVMGSNFADWLINKHKEVKEGRIHVGVTCGFPKFEQCIGGGFRDGTVNVIAARSKMGKSFLALTMADNVARQGYPVLYLDTELSDEYQTIRRVSRLTKIPLYQLETGAFFGDNIRETAAKNAVHDLERNKVYYVDIKGWNIEEQVSIIRRFFAKVVGKNKEGRFNRCLVILDYLKLMKAEDKNSDKEWEALGYRMTALHDLMSEYQSPMLALAQQNRDGLEKENESTISGSDRIIWLCDNFSIFAKMDEADILARQASSNQDPNARKPENCKLKVVVCRHGPGTPGKKFIGIYADIHDPSLQMDEVCGIIEERAISTTIVSK